MKGLGIFLTDTRGGSTVDYVVLVAALIGLGLSVVNAVNIGSVEGVTHITDAIRDAQMEACQGGAGGPAIGSCDTAQ